MPSIHNSNLLYRPSLSIWTARKKDRDESSKVTQTNGAVAGSANVYKALLPESKELEAIQKWANQFREFTYTNTLPWDDGGWRIGQVARHMDFMAKVGDRLRDGDARVEAFLDVYQAAVENARFTLADLFNAGDYPGVDEVRSKFRFTVDVQTLPNVEDFRVLDGVPADEVDKLVGIAKNSVETRVQAAMDTAYERLYEVVAKMGSTLHLYGTGEIKKFNDTLVGNIAELVEAMPALNITGDAKLAALATKAQELTMYACMDLRKSPDVRKAAIVEAKALAAEIRPVDAPPPGQPVSVTSRPTEGVFADMLEA